MPFCKHILCSVLSLRSGTLTHTKPIENTMILCVNLRAKEMAFIFLQKCFWKQLILAVLRHIAHESCVYRDFSGCVKKLLGKLALNKVQRSFNLVTKIRTSEIIILCAFLSFQERSQNPLKAPGFVALRTLWIQKKKVDAIKTRLQSNRWFERMKSVTFFIVVFIFIYWL